MAAHRYWRVYVTATETGYVGFSEIELRNALGGSDLTGSGTASASSEFSGTYAASKAVDNDTGTQWTGSDPGTQWWKYDFGSGVTYDIIQFKITPRTDGAYTQGPGTFNLEYSDDNSSWTAAGSWSGVVWTDTTPKTFSLATAPMQVAHLVVEFIVTGASLTFSKSDTLSLSDAAEVSSSGGATPHTISISESFSLTEGSVKAQRKNAPNIPIIAFDTFSDSFEIVGDFGLQLDTMQDAQFQWDITDVFNLTDEIYASEFNEFSFEDFFDSLSDEAALEIAVGIEVYDSFQDVWDPEEEIALEVAFAVPMELSFDDALSFSDALEFIRDSGQELEDRFTLSDSVRVRGESGLGIVGDLLALSDALEIGWNPSVDVSDALSFDDSGGVETMMPSKIEIEVGVSDTRLVVTEGLALFDGDFSTQGTEVFLGGTRLGYLRRYLNDVPR